jgi:AP-1-like factor
LPPKLFGFRDDNNTNFVGMNDPTNAGSSISFDWFTTQNGGYFEFLGNHIAPQNEIVSQQDFIGDLYGQVPTVDFSTPFNWADLIAPTGLTPPRQHSDDEDEDEDEVVPGEDMASLLSCHKIWDKLQDRPDFKDGSLDIDGLCFELRAKARCSESGVVIDQRDVDAALNRLPGRRWESSVPTALDS